MEHFIVAELFLHIVPNKCVPGIAFFKGGEGQAAFGDAARPFTVPYCTFVFTKAHFCFPASGQDKSRGHRCCPFFPPAPAFILHAKSSPFPLLVDFHTWKVANSRPRAFR